MIITVAAGTLTPTSITVVATRIEVSRAVKAAIAASFSAPESLAVNEADALSEDLAQMSRALLGGGHVARRFAVDGRTDPVNLRSFPQSAVQTFDDVFQAVLGNGSRRHRLASGRLFGELRHIEVTVHRQKQRARDRRRRHDKDVRVAGLGLLLQRKALRHSEPMLLIDNGKGEIMEHDIGLKQGVRANHELDFAGSQLLQQQGPGLPLLATGEIAEPDARRFA